MPRKTDLAHVGGYFGRYFGLMLAIFSLSLPIGWNGRAYAAAHDTAASEAQADYLPDVTLIDQHGAKVPLASLRGKPVLVGFIHTLCKGPCEMMTAKMHSVETSLKDRSRAGLNIISITTDPADDTPAQLLKYSQSQGVTGDRWLFLTGSHDDIERVMHIYHVSHIDDDDAMMHVMKLFLVGPDGRLVGTYPGMDSNPKLIAADIEKYARGR
jgi:protein SCO1/2